ncbi:MAG: putative S-layer protein [Nanoarchaeota archaeon]
MNKILIILLMALLVSVSSALALGDLTVTDIVNPTAGNPGASVAGSFKVNNVGTGTVSGIVFVKNDLVQAADPTKKILNGQISFNPATIASLSAGQSNTVTSTVAIPNATRPGTYTGSVEVRDGATTPAHSATFSLSVVVNSFPQLSVDSFTDTTPLEIKEEQGETATGTFVIRNTGNADLSNLNINHNITLTDNDNDVITLTFTGLPASLAVGASSTITVNANIDEDVDFGTYSGLVTVKDNVLQNALKTFKLDIKVEPRICEDGVRSDGRPGGDNIRIEIKEPGTSDRFSPGEEIKVELRVRNNDNEDHDVVVEGFLYDLDDNDLLVDVDPTDSIEVKDGEREDFELTVEVPIDVDIDHEIVLFVKAYEEDAEDENCGEERRDLNLRRERHSVIIDKITFTPSTLACSETFDAVVELHNIGTSDETDVTVRLFDNELKIDQVSSAVNLDKFDDKDDEATVRFRDIRIPDNAQKKQYQVESILSFRDDTKSKFTTLTINRCEEETTSNVEGQGTLQALVSSFALGEGESFTVPVSITNTEKEAVQFTLEMQNTEDFAQGAAPKSIALSPGQSETVFFNLRTKEGLVEGKYTGVVVLKAGNEVVDTKSFTVDVQKTGLLDGFTTTGLSGTKVFWIIADVILVVIAIFFLKLIFGSKKKKVE